VFETWTYRYLHFFKCMPKVLYLKHYSFFSLDILNSWLVHENNDFERDQRVKCSKNLKFQSSLFISKSVKIVYDSYYVYISPVLLKYLKILIDLNNL